MSGKSNRDRGATSRNATVSRKAPVPVSAARLTRDQKATAARRHPESGLPAEADTSERLRQFTLSMRESLHKELARSAMAEGMTMRGVIMSALRDFGLDVRDEDLVDRRRS